MPETRKFTFGYYFRSVTTLLGEPRRFFSGLAPDTGCRHSAGFLLVSSVFFTGASLTQNVYSHPGIMGCIFMVNAVGMVLISAGLGYVVMALTIGRQVPFARLFSVYAFSFGVTLLASWVPFFVWLTEPWKWWLIGTGLTAHCAFSRRQSFFIVGMSIGILILFLWSVLPSIRFLKTQF